MNALVLEAWHLGEKQPCFAHCPLCDYGLTEDAIPEAADAILSAVPAGNSRPVTAEDPRRLLHAAWAGTAPKDEI